MLTQIQLPWGRSARWRALLVAAGLALLALPLQAQPPSFAQGASVRFEELVEAELAGSSDPIDRSVLLLYRLRNYRTWWHAGAQLEGLQAAIAALPSHGLDSADFSPARVAAVDLASAPENTLGRVNAELLLTRTLARLLHQLRYGRVDPRQLYPTWNFTPPPAALGLAQQLARLLELPALSQPGDGAEFARAVLAQAPGLAAYRQLQQGLEEYRARAAVSSSWPQVPEGPSLRPGERSGRVLALRARLEAEGEVGPASPAAAELFDDELAAAVRRFQHRAGLAVDGVVGSQTVAALNRGLQQRVDQLRVNLERLRWVASDLATADHLLVDLTAATIHLYRDHQLQWTTRAIIGRPTRQTPSLLDSVHQLVLNPKWVVPPTILRQDLIPGVLRDPTYLAKRRLRVFDHAGHVVDPQAIDWAGARQHGFPYRVVQDSGVDGTLGQIKFALGNSYAIYLHDTDARGLFGRQGRALSSGCVRVERPLELAVLLLDDEARWNLASLQEAIASGKTRTITVSHPLPVLLHYVTAATDEHGKLQFRPDPYQRDAEVLAALDARRR